MRFTEDFYTIAETDYAYEIMYSYLNPEISEPYPNKTLVSKIPKEARIWKEEEKCQAAINKMQKQKTKS